MKLDKAIVQRRLDLMAAEGVVRKAILYLCPRTHPCLDFCIKRTCGRQRRLRATQGGERRRRDLHWCNLAA